MKINDESVMRGKKLVDDAIEDIQRLAKMADEAKVASCRAGDKCEGATRDEHYDNRDILSLMRAEALAAEVHLERFRSLGGGISVGQARWGST